MKPFLTALFLTLAFTLSGCGMTATDPIVVLAEANDSLAASETVLTSLDKAHVIPAGDRPAIATAVQIAQKDIAVANAQGNLTSTSSILAQVQADVAAVTTLRLKYKPTVAPATQP